MGNLRCRPRQAQAAHRVGRRFADKLLVDALEMERRQAGDGGKRLQVQFFVDMLVYIRGDPANTLTMIDNAIWFHGLCTHAAISVYSARKIRERCYPFCAFAGIAPGATLNRPNLLTVLNRDLLKTSVTPVGHKDRKRPPFQLSPWRCPRP
jgi:hypothetical protein